jgi:hypothetical protein
MYRSAWVEPDGDGECTPPAVSTKSHPAPREAWREAKREISARRASSVGMVCSWYWCEIRD